MAITRLNLFGGEAEVMGKAVRVGVGLTIYGLTLEEAERALNLLSTGAVAGVRLPERQPGNAKPAQPEKFPSHRGTEAARDPYAPPPVACGGCTPVPQVEEEGKEQQDDTAEKPKPKAVALVADPKAAKALHDMTSLGEVVVYLYEKGTVEVDALVAQCAALKEEVPLLSRIANLDERVRRAYEIKGLGQPQ
jgi:hypothetical protein